MKTQPETSSSDPSIPDASRLEATSDAPKSSALYELYQKRHKELLESAREQSEIVSGLGMDDVQREGTKLGEIVDGLIGRLESDKLRVLVVGRFSSGKSTFINSLFGETVLPASPTPTTGVLCEITHADAAGKKAILYPKAEYADGEDAGPREIAITDLNAELGRYVKINHAAEGRDETSRYEKMKIHWPLDLCANGVDIIDSVGLDDPESRDKITLDYVSSADAILYCMKSIDAYSARDKSVLNLLTSLGHDSIFFVITYFDHIKQSALMGEGSESEFKDYMFKTLAPWTDLGRDGVKFVDSKSALMRRMRGITDGLDETGILEVEQDLESFLVEQKGRAKLVTSLRSLRVVNRSVRQTIPSRIGMLESTVADLEKRYAEAEAPLQWLEEKRRFMIERVASAIKDTRREARDLADQYFDGLPEKITDWAVDCELEEGVIFPPTKAKIEPVVREVLEHLKAEVQGDIAEWNSEVLSPMIEANIAEMQAALEPDARAFVASVEDLRVRIAVGDQIDDDQIAKDEEPTVMGRLLAGGYTLMTGDFLTGGMGMVLGLQAMLRTILLQVVAGILLAFFGMLNPVAIIAAVIAAILGGGFWNALSLKEGIKKKVAEKLVQEMATRKPALSAMVAKEVGDKLDELKDALDAGLGGEISRVRGEVERILEEKRSGQMNADEEIQKLRAFEARNAALEERLEDLLIEAGLMPTDRSARDRDASAVVG